MCSMLFACVALAVLGIVIQRKQGLFDDQQQTVSDYAVQVLNPPRDGQCEKEWKDYFSQFGHVTAITIALDNQELLRNLYERRSYLTRLEGLLPAGIELDPMKYKDVILEAAPLAWYWKLFGYLDAKAISKELETIDDVIEHYL